MGKIPQSFRATTLPVTTILKKPSSLSPSQSPSPTPSQKPHHFPKKNPTKRKPQLSGKVQPEKSEITFNSPNLSDAKKFFTSLITTPKAPLDLRFHNSLLQSFSSISTVHDSISLLRHMTKTHPSFTPDRSTYHILLTESCKSPDSTLSGVHQTLNLMVTDGCPPDRVTTDIAIRSLCSAGREDHAVELVKELSRKHSPPDIFTYNFIIRHLCKTRALSTVYNFMNEMQNSFDLKPDLVTYTILIDNVCNSKNLREASKLLGVLAKAGFKPDCFVYNTIMRGYFLLNRGIDCNWHL
ncbi:hypothetical protein L1049_001764 [Liquidambar formosana]|uniref:Pentatricopeptide repeat-containing protein n=1 Tax=Liquidambar formosana TaxID=63359 RepID=A0AAP0N6E7_LIQFO